MTEIQHGTRVRRRADAGSFHEDAWRTAEENGESSGSSRGAGWLRGSVAPQLCMVFRAAMNEAFECLTRSRKRRRFRGSMVIRHLRLRLRVKRIRSSRSRTGPVPQAKNIGLNDAESLIALFPRRMNCVNQPHRVNSVCVKSLSDRELSQHHAPRLPSGSGDG